ncbi:MAG: NAD(P)H-hydrate epimerase [Candidatus Dojkabacteria bacterium]
MDSLNINSKIIYTNAKHFGIDLASLYKVSAEKIASLLIEKYGVNKSYSVICGLGGNGGDGFAVAYELVKKVKKIGIYLVGRPNSIEDPVARELWDKLKKLSQANLTIKQDCYAKDITQGDVTLECLIGTGLVGEKLNKRFGDVIKRVSHFKKSIVALDVPIPSYSPDLTISLLYPKTKSAEVIEISLPKELQIYPGPGEFEALFRPKTHSYKVQNGRLLYVFNSEHSEELESIINFAEDYHVQIYVYSPNEVKPNKKIVVVKEEELDEAIALADSIYLGEFDKTSLLNRALVLEILSYKFRKYIFNKSALRFISPEVLSKIPEKLFILEKDIACKIDPKSVKGSKRIAIEFKASLIVPSIQSYLYSDTGEFRLDLTGKLFEKKLQQELLNLAAVLSTKNDIWLALRAADFMLVNL